MELEKFTSTRDIQDLLALRSDIEALSAGTPKADTGPKLELLDLGPAYRLIVEVPGVSQENLEVALQGRSLTVAGLREPGYDGLGDGMGDGASDSVDIILSERSSGHFQRSLELPGEVDYDRSHASLHDGLLVLDLPKA